MYKNDIDNHIYTNALETYILANKSIPRKLKNGEYLKLYHKYWLDSYGAIKIQDIFVENNTQYYVIRFSDKLSACIPHPAEILYSFELLHNTTDGVENENIIEDNKYYSGAEIRYWFTINNMISIYPDVYEYLSYTSKSSIIDNKLYSVKCLNKKYIRIIERINPEE